MIPLVALALAALAAAPQAPAAKPAVTVPKDPAKARLEASPRHHEWIDVEHDARKVHCFVVYPEVKDKALTVLLIHENKGLTDWVRSVADHLAELGYVAIAPDLLSGAGPKGGNTDSFASIDDTTSAIYKLDAARVSADLEAVAAYAKKIPSANGKLAVAGFCWGGGQAFSFAAQHPGLAASFVFYGSAPKDDVLAKIGCPVYGFYGEADARITSTVEATSAAMKQAGKTYEPVVYANAGHGFVREGELKTSSPENQKACVDAWARWKELLAKVAAK